MDGAPAHSTADVRNLLDRHFPGRWMGRMGPVVWPPRSPDLSPNDFFLWGYLKTKIYTQQFNTVEELTQKIRTVCDELDPIFIRNATQEFRHRLAYCLEVQGGHFENML